MFSKMSFFTSSSANQWVCSDSRYRKWLSIIRHFG